MAIVGQAAAGLDAAHRRGLVHRDVKPGNILIGEDDHVYVSDFGLTKQASSQSGLTATGQLVGTVDYVAPEQIQGQPVDGRTDVYSLTCVLYEALVGSKPFEKDTEVATIWAHIQDPPPAPSALRPGLPKALDDVIAKGMAKQPDDRYPTCRALVDAARRELGVSSGEIPMPTAPSRTRIDRRLLAATATVIAIAVVVVVLLTRGGGTSVASLPLNAVGAIDPKTNNLVASIPVGKSPVAIAAGAGSIWVANQDDGTVTRIDPRTRRVQRVIGITGTPLAVAVGEGKVWVTTLEGRLFAIDPSSNAASEVPGRLAFLRTSRSAGVELTGVAAGRGSVWILYAGGDQVLRFDPMSGQITERFGLSGLPTAIALGLGGLWISEVNTVNRIDLATKVMTGTAQIGTLLNTDDSTTVAVGRASVWVARQDSGEVWQVSPGSTTAVGKTLVGPGLGGIATGFDGIWVARPRAGTVVRLDPATAKVTKTVNVGTGAHAVTTGYGYVWVATTQPGAERNIP